jgi:phosphatidylcholine synthase
MHLSTFAVSVILLVCTVLVFVPICYLYPSRTRTLRTTNLVLTALWLLLYAVQLWQMPHPAGWIVLASLAYLGYYLGVSFVLTSRRRTSEPAVAVSA